MQHFTELEEAGRLPPFIYRMIDKQKLTDTVEQAIAGTDLFVVDIRVTPDNSITVEIDSPTAVDIDSCAAITRAIEGALDRDVEDYELEVGSAGLTAPFKVPGQYFKNVGNEVEALTADGRKIRGILAEVAPDASTFVIEVPTKVKAEGAKRPHIEMVPVTLTPAQCKSVTYVIDFK